jgi:hypothetical protein
VWGPGAPPPAGARAPPSLPGAASPPNPRRRAQALAAQAAGAAALVAVQPDEALPGIAISEADYGVVLSVRIPVVAIRASDAAALRAALAARGGGGGGGGGDATLVAHRQPRDGALDASVIYHEAAVGGGFGLGGGGGCAGPARLFWGRCVRVRGHFLLGVYVLGEFGCTAHVSHARTPP